MNRREFITGAALAMDVIAAWAGTDPNPRDFTELDLNYRNKAVQLAARDCGDCLVDFIDSTAWFDTVADRGDCFMDGGHQNDIGAEIMAKPISGRLGRMLA